MRWKKYILDDWGHFLRSSNVDLLCCLILFLFFYMPFKMKSKVFLRFTEALCLWVKRYVIELQQKLKWECIFWKVIALKKSFPFHISCKVFIYCRKYNFHSSFKYSMEKLIVWNILKLHYTSANIKFYNLFSFCFEIKLKKNYDNN